MTRYSLSLFSAFFALLISLASACPADDTAKLPTWKANPKIVAGLGPDYPLYGSALHLPQTFNLTDSKVDDKADIRLWQGFTYSNGFHAEFVVLAVPIPANAEVPASVVTRIQSDVLKIGRDVLSSDFSDWVQSNPERGSVGTKTFDRLYFKAFDQRLLKEVHGFVYTTVTEKCIYGFFAGDTEPYNKISLPTLEAAVLTLHPSDAPTTPVPTNILNKWPDDDH